MTKLTLTIVADSDDKARTLLYRLAAMLAEDLDDVGKLTVTGTDAYSVSRDYGNASCDVARFEPVCGSQAEIDRLAAAFTEHVRAFFWDDSVGDTNDDFMLVLERNAEESDPSICHTHDFCDANILMSKAWKDCFPHEPFVPQNTFHCQLWSAAWQQARAAEFSPTPSLPISPSSDSPAA